MNLSNLVKHEKKMLLTLKRKYEEYSAYCVNRNNCEVCKYYDIDNDCYLSYVRDNDEYINLD